MPVIICIRLVVIPVEGLILFIPLAGIVGFCIIHPDFDLKSDTIVDSKVRMNN